MDCMEILLCTWILSLGKATGSRVRVAPGKVGTS